MTTEKPNYEQERELGKLLAAANLQRMRGQWTDAEDTCRRALSLAPNDAALHEVLGDILREIGKLDAAMAEYKIAMGLAPVKPALETKYAKLTLEIGEKEHERILAEDMIANPKKYTTREKKPIMALVYAIMLPGLGQFYNGEIVKASIILGSLLLFLASFALFPTHPRDPNSMAGLLNGIDPIVQWLGSVAAIAYLYGLVDAPVRAEKSSKAARAKNPAEPQ